MRYIAVRFEQCVIFSMLRSLDWLLSSISLYVRTYVSEVGSDRPETTMSASVRQQLFQLRVSLVNR
jgi:hypothetical protein